MKRVLISPPMNREASRYRYLLDFTRSKQIRERSLKRQGHTIVNRLVQIRFAYMTRSETVDTEMHQLCCHFRAHGWFVSNAFGKRTFVFLVPNSRSYLISQGNGVFEWLGLTRPGIVY